MEGIRYLLPVFATACRCVPVASLALLATAGASGSALADEQTYTTYQPVVTLRDTGPPDNRYDFLIATDGYTGASDWKAHALSDEITTYFVTPKDQKTVNEECAADPGCRVDTEPYVRYRGFLNFHRIRAFSNEDFNREDAHLDPVPTRDVILVQRDTIYHLAQLHAVEATAQDSSMDIGLERDAGFWVAENYLRMGLGAWPGTNAAFTLPGEVAAHEGGHGNHELADQYFTPGQAYTAGLPLPEWNVTSDPACTKWRHWLGYVDTRVSVTGALLGPVGCYEGGRYVQYGVFRAVAGEYASRMAATGPFNRVAAEKVIHDIYGSVRPLDGFRSNQQELRDPALLWVSEVDPAVIKVDWLIADSAGNVVHQRPMAGDMLDIRSLCLAPGRYRVTVHAYDEAILHAYSDREPRTVDAMVVPGRLPHPLDIARKPEVLERMQQNVSWRILLTGDLPADGLPDGGQGGCGTTASVPGGNAGVQVHDDQRFVVDRQRTEGAIVGWVRVNAPRDHEIRLEDDRGWLRVDSETGRLEVRDSAALGRESLGLFSVPVVVTSMLGANEIVARGVVQIDVNDSRYSMLDEFDDDDPGSNTLANGRGFGAQWPESHAVAERDGLLHVTMDGSDPTFKEVAVLSKDSFDFATGDGIEVTWKIARIEAPVGIASCYLTISSAKTVPSPQLVAGAMPLTRMSLVRLALVRGVTIRICGERGSLAAIDPWGLDQNELGHWRWPDVGWDGASPLEITLSADADAVRVRVGSIEVAHAPWPAEFSDKVVQGRLDGPEPFSGRTVRAGILMRGAGPATISFEAVEARVPPPVDDGHVNRPPRLAQGGVPGRQSVTGQSLSLDLNDYVTDPDGDPLQFRVTGLPPGLAAQDDGIIAGAPTQPGRYQVSFSASDGVAGVVGTFGIEVAPVVSRARSRDTRRGETGPRLVRPLENLAVTVGEPVSLDLAEHFDDPGGDALSFGLAGLPGGLSVGPDGLLQGAPVEPGKALVYVSVSDGRTRMPAMTFTIDVVESTEPNSDRGAPVEQAVANRAPRLIKPLPDVVAPFGKLVTVDLEDYFADPDGDPLEYGLTGNPPGLRLHDGSVLRGIMPPGGQWTIGVTVTDPHGDTAASVLSVRVETRSRSLRNGDRRTGRSSRSAPHH